MATSLSEVAPAFVDMAHRIVWCSAATVDRANRPRSRVLHPIWEWAFDLPTRERIWNLFKSAPPPVGYDPAIIPGWDGPDSPGFAVLRLTPWRLRVMPGTVLLASEGDVLSWTADLDR